MSETMKRRGHNEKIFAACNASLLFVVLVLCLYPLIYVLSASFSDPAVVISGEMLLFPKDVTLDSYERVFAHPDIMVGYKNTLIYTVLGTAVNMIMTVLCAYPLSRKDLGGRGLIMALIVFTMYFSGGLIPTYLVVSRWLNLKNTVWAVVLPGAISVYNMIIVRNYFVNSIPGDLNEAAMIDGCSDFRLLGSIILPLSMPVLAVVGMYYMVGHWNSWYSAMLYMTKKSFYPLQLVLKTILITDPEALLDASDTEDVMRQIMLTESIKYSVIVVASAPMLAVYPFLQKFFVKGVMVGAIKG